MSEDDINAAIARECGWKDVHRKPGFSCLILGIPPQGWQFKIASSHADHRELPNFCGDLNAMHQAEQALWARDWGARARFVDALARILSPVHGYANQDGEDLLDATAKDRAKAFLLAVEKWEEAA